VTDYLLDTNIVSDVTKLAPSQRLVDWLAVQDDQRLFIASLTLGKSGVAFTPCRVDESGKRLKLGSSAPRGPPRFSLDAFSPSIRERRLNGRNSWPKATGRGVPAVQLI
jgi:hypothetical protein